MQQPNVPEPLLLPDDPLRVGCCLFTSGSTGKPKGVLIGERDLTARAWAEAQWYQLNEQDVLLNILPFSFDVGLNQVLSAMCVGCSLVLLNSWLPADILDAVSERQVTGISAVPSIWSDFLKANLRFDTRGAARVAALHYHFRRRPESREAGPATGDAGWRRDHQDLRADRDIPVHCTVAAGVFSQATERWSSLRQRPGIRREGRRDAG